MRQTYHRLFRFLGIRSKSKIYIEDIVDVHKVKRDVARTKKALTNLGKALTKQGLTCEEIKIKYNQNN